MAQVIAIVVSPILTRIYTPEAFGELAVYLSVVSILSVLATGRYEYGIMLPNSDSDALNLTALCLMTAIVVSLISFIILGVFNHQISLLLGNTAISPWLYAIPLSMFIGATSQALGYWSIRLRKYRRVSALKVTQSASTASLSLGFGIIGAYKNGLIVSSILGPILNSGILCWQVIRYDIRNGIRVDVRWKTITKLGSYYNKFPLFSVPADFLNTILNQLPIIFLSHYYGANVVGLYALTQRVFTAPITLLANSITDVFKQRASSDYASHGNCKTIYLKTLKYLSVVAFLPFLVFFLPLQGFLPLLLGRNGV